MQSTCNQWSSTNEYVCDEVGDEVDPKNYAELGGEPFFASIKQEDINFPSTSCNCKPQLWICSEYGSWLRETMTD
jgi:hypothetical protein